MVFEYNVSTSPLKFSNVMIYCDKLPITVCTKEQCNFVRLCSSSLILGMQAVDFL